MDPSAVNWNVIIDDFDSILTYEDHSVWTTPLADPSASNYDATNSPWPRALHCMFMEMSAHNSGPVFSGESTAFTNGDGASFSFRVSAVYVPGDKKNDHGIYSIILDNLPSITLDGVSGCGGAFGTSCEQQQPSIKYLVSNLDDSIHNLTLVNRAGVNNSFFDLDSIVVTVPSRYAPRQLSSGASPFVVGTSTLSQIDSADSAPTATGAAASAAVISNPLFLVILPPTIRVS